MQVRNHLFSRKRARGVSDAPLAAMVSFPTVLRDACALFLLQKTPERYPRNGFARAPETKGLRSPAPTQ